MNSVSQSLLFLLFSFQVSLPSLFSHSKTSPPSLATCFRGPTLVAAGKHNAVLKSVGFFSLLSRIMPIFHGYLM